MTGPHDSNKSVPGHTIAIHVTIPKENENIPTDRDGLENND